MELSMWENIFVGLMAVGLIFWMFPGIKASMERSKNAKSDWAGFLLPMAAVVILVVFLISMV
jgi:hypothetical protein